MRPLKEFSSISWWERLTDERKLDEIVSVYPRERKIVIYCACPDEVSAAWMAAQLRKHQFVDVMPLRGGIDAWRERGFEVHAIRHDVAGAEQPPLPEPAQVP